jgi:lantibiotic modifying enzyme
MLIDTKLKEIADGITEHLLNSEARKEIGLYTGVVGLLMFMAYYSRYSGEEKYTKIAKYLLDVCSESICGGVYYTPFCDGLSGMLYGLSHLNKVGFIDVDLSEVHEGYSQYLRTSLRTYTKERELGFMHGAIGIALHLLQNGSPKDIAEVAEFVIILDSIAEHEKGTTKWKSNIGVDKENGYSIAMSHGMSSMSIFFALCLERGVKPQISSKLLTGAIEYILQQEIDYKTYYSYFPPTSMGANIITKSRMAWCHGDLGIAIALWRAGVVLSNNSWKSKSIEIMEFAVNRRKLAFDSVVDACICHGTAGIAQIFRRMYYYTGNDKFLSSSKFWISETMKMAMWDNSKAAGFMHYRLNTQNGW